MTVTYTAQVATSSFSCFLKLLARWRGSVYRLMWKDFTLFAGIYYLLAFLYHFGLNQEQKITFEKIARYCEGHNNLIPLAFVLGFFVTLVVNRWWLHIQCIPFPDNTAVYVAAALRGRDESDRLMRRTIMRYVCLSYVILMSSISIAVKKRFPTFQYMTDAGIMLPKEQKIIEAIQTRNNKFFAPLVWATSLVERARREGHIKDDMAVKSLNDSIVEFRSNLARLWMLDWQTVPLVYTQVVTLAVYTFFFSCLMGRQFLEDQPDMPDMYFPIFTFLQFFFYMGWLKVAESLINPFGEDDEDCELNNLIDRNLQISYIIVDEMQSGEHPDLLRDQHWDETHVSLPYTAASEHCRIKSHLGSAINPNPLMHDFEAYDEASLEAPNEDDPLDAQPGPGSRYRPIPKAPSGFFVSLASSLRSLTRHGLGNKRRSLGGSVLSGTRGRDSEVSEGWVEQGSVRRGRGSVTSLNSIAEDDNHHEDIFRMSDLYICNNKDNIPVHNENKDDLPMDRVTFQHHHCDENDRSSVHVHFESELSHSRATSGDNKTDIEQPFVSEFNSSRQQLISAKVQKENTEMFGPMHQNPLSQSSLTLETCPSETKEAIKVLPLIGCRGESGNLNPAERHNVQENRSFSKLGSTVGSAQKGGTNNMETLPVSEGGSDGKKKRNNRRDSPADLLPYMNKYQPI